MAPSERGLWAVGLAGTEAGQCCWQSTDVSLKSPVCPDWGAELGLAQPWALGGTACPSPIVLPCLCSVQPQMLD